MRKTKEETTTKAEIVRQRRSQQSKKKLENKGYRAQNIAASKTPPVMLRRGYTGTPVVQRTQSKVRRKITLPLKTPGTEIVMPGLPIIKPGWRILSGLLVIVLAVFLLLVNSLSNFKTGNITITGLQRLNATDIANVLKIYEKPIFMIDPQVIRFEIEEAFNELTDVSVEVIPPGTVAINVRERQPVLAWHYDNLILWIDNEGVIFSPKGEAGYLFTIYAQEGPPKMAIVEDFTKEDPLLNSNDAHSAGPDIKNRISGKGLVNPDFILSAIKLGERLPAGTVLSYTKKDGFGWHDDQNNWNVYVGFELDNLEQKMLVYENIVHMVLDKDIHPNMISVAFVHAPFFRLE
ncbi:MAG: FtsQ-type POTRA domain-containing protein [Anaerolineaceae bacterium]|nr:FtsQ-type POTRA domain-containing protein [Anaerolineaceae bacterium]